MKKIAIFALMLALPAAPLAAAQLYRWVDDKGNVEWRDTPPPANAKKVERRNIETNTIQTEALPYSLQLAVKNFPVTLWVFNCGDPCDKARAHLAKRGVPYTEKNPQNDLEGFKKLTGGSLDVPLLIVGNNQLKGYLASDWDAALDAAGYPKTALIQVKPRVEPAPATPAPQPAAPAAPAAPAK